MIVKTETKGPTTVEMVDYTPYGHNRYVVAVTGKADFVFEDPTKARVQATRKFRVEAVKAALAVARAA